MSSAPPGTRVIQRVVPLAHLHERRDATGGFDGSGLRLVRLGVEYGEMKHEYVYYAGIHGKK